MKSQLIELINKGMETAPKTINSIRTIEILPTLKKYARFIKNEKKQRATFLTNDF